MKFRFLCGDHTFKCCKYINTASGEHAFVAVYTLMNEFCQIVGQWFVKSKSLVELTEAFQKLAARFERLGEVCHTCIFAAP